MNYRQLLALAALSMSALDTVTAQSVETITVAAGERRRVWYGVLTMGTIYLKVRNASGNCADFVWRYGPFRRRVGTLCGDAQLKNFSPVAALWIERPATITTVAVSDDARAINLMPLCKVGVQCPFEP